MNKEGKNRENKRGQVTIFIIIAIIIVALAVLMFMLFSGSPTITQVDSENPSAFLQNCLEDDIKDRVDTLSLQGGSLNPKSSYLYEGNKLDYLCYTSKYYQTCTVQQPILDQNIENEINLGIQPQVANCFNSLKSSFEGKGYTVDLRSGDTHVELLPKRIVVTLTYPLTLTKGGTQNFEEFRVILNNNLFELVSIAESITSWESSFGDAETTLYMDAYRDLKVEKYKQSDGTTVYILTDRNNGNKFQFASRSMAWPPGLVIDEALL